MVIKRVVKDQVDLTRTVLLELKQVGKFFFTSSENIYKNHDMTISDTVENFVIGFCFV